MVCSPFGAGVVPAEFGAGAGFFSPDPHPGRIVKDAIPIGNAKRANFFTQDLHQDLHNAFTGILAGRNLLCFVRRQSAFVAIGNGCQCQ
jgi:hypothetical protein